MSVRTLTDRNTNGLTRWQRNTQLQQHFWKRWQKEYLSQLQTRPRGQQHQHPNVDIGALVVLIEDNLPPLQWRLGRVVHVHPGSDGVVRVVSVIFHFKSFFSFLSFLVFSCFVTSTIWFFFYSFLCMYFFSFVNVEVINFKGGGIFRPLALALVRVTTPPNANPC
jgi:hypothetical protein